MLEKKCDGSRIKEEREGGLGIRCFPGHETHMGGFDCWAARPGVRKNESGMWVEERGDRA